MVLGPRKSIVHAQVNNLIFLYPFHIPKNKIPVAFTVQRGLMITC